MTLCLNFADFEQVKNLTVIADFEQVKKISSYFAAFEQVKNLIVILLTLNKQWLFLRWLLLTFCLCKTPLGETGCLENPYFWFYWLTKHPVFWFTSNTVS